MTKLIDKIIFKFKKAIKGIVKIFWYRFHWSYIRFI